MADGWRPGSVVSVLECAPPLLEPDRQLLGDALLLDFLVQLLDLDVHQILQHTDTVVNRCHIGNQCCGSATF